MGREGEGEERKGVGGREGEGKGGEVTGRRSDTRLKCLREAGS